MGAKALSRSLVFLIGAVMAMDFMIVLTSIAGFWAYIGGDLKWYGLVFSVYDFTQFFTGPLLGLWVDKRNYREVFIITIIVNAIGNFLYSYSYDARSIPMFVIGRCVAGLGSGNLSVGFGYLALSSTNEERSTVFGLYRLWSTVGRMSGPFLGAFLFFVGSTKVGHFTLNAYTLPAYIMIVADIILIPLVFLLKEPRANHELSDVKEEKISKAEAFKALGKDGFVSNALYFLAILAFWSWFPLVLVFAVVEYGFKPTGGEYAFAYSAVGWGFGGSVLFLRSFQDKLKDYYWLASGPLFMIAGFIIFMFKGGTALYLIGTTILCFGFNLVATVSSTYFSKLIQEKGLTAYMATFMGGQFAISSLGRFLGPTWAPAALKFGASGYGCCDYTASPPILDCCTIDGQYQVFGLLLGFTFFLQIGSIFLLRKDLDDKLKINENTERARLLGKPTEEVQRYE